MKRFTCYTDTVYGHLVRLIRHHWRDVKKNKSVCGSLSWVSSSNRKITQEPIGISEPHLGHKNYTCVHNRQEIRDIQP